MLTFDTEALLSVARLTLEGICGVHACGTHKTLTGAAIVLTELVTIFAGKLQGSQKILTITISTLHYNHTGFFFCQYEPKIHFTLPK